MRTLLVLASVLMLFSAYACAEVDVISNVSIEGLQNVGTRSVLLVTNLKKGKCYSIAAAKEDIRSILETGYFDNVEVCFDNIDGNLIFVVEEKPYIESIVFNGNLEFSDGDLKRASVLKAKNYYDFSKLEETKEKIKSLYRNKGYADCEIEVYPTADVNTNKMTITFLITENSRIIIEEVKVEGISFFKEKKFLSLLRQNREKYLMRIFTRQI